MKTTTKLTDGTNTVTFSMTSDRVVMSNSAGEYAVISREEMVERAFWLRKAGWR